MNRVLQKRYRIPPYLLILFVFVGYVGLFLVYHDKVGTGIGSLALIPIIAASWYYGWVGGLAVAAFSILANIFILLIKDHSPFELFISPGNVIDVFSLFLVAVVTGSYASLLQERKAIIHKLEQFEQSRESHTSFLELLNGITARALEADSLQTTLEILTEKVAHLFNADDAFFAFWDEERNIPIPTVAYGSMKDIYPYMQFEPDDAPPTAAVMKTGRILFIDDIDNSPHINSRIAAMFPSRSMLGIPFITHQRKLGAVVLGYNKKSNLGDNDISHAEIVAEQVALVLSKSLLLEDERKQVRQLTALHDVALVSIDADNEDQLIERVTDIIGQNLYPDNFGILLLDEQAGILRPHLSYRFYLAEDLVMQDISLDLGIIGQVARSGQSQRIGNVRRHPDYIDVDDRTISELCVPIKFKEHILGVINAESTKRDAFTVDDERLLVTLAGQLATAMEQLRKALVERVILGQLAHAKDLIYSIAQITTQIESTLNPDQIVKTMGIELGKIGLTCIMAVYNEQSTSFTVNYTSLQPRLLEIIENGLGYPLLNYAFPRQKLDAILKTEDLLHPMVIARPVEEVMALFKRVKKDGIAGTLEKIGITENVELLRLPLVFEESLQGVLWLWGRDINQSDLPILSIFAKQIGITLERARLFQEVQSLALTDALTGLQNRRSLFELGRIEFSRAQRMKRPFSCMMMDIDHFKRINDQYGHQVGDEVLQEFGRRCKTYIREIDLAGRYGGEEFMILLPETDRNTGLIVAERFRKLMAENPIQASCGPLNITVSIGVAMKDDQTIDLNTLVARADQALYIAKHKGRNRVSISV